MLPLICNNSSRFEVAIKEATTADSKEEMLDEAKSMIRVSKHDHIVNFQGISINSGHVYLLLEFCHFGSIHKFLQLKEAEFRIKLQKQSNRELICWSSQVANAMGFLAKNDIIHVRNFHVLSYKSDDFTNFQS